MKYIYNILVCMVAFTFATLAQFSLTTPFQIQDLEEGPTNCVVSVTPSNTTLVPLSNVKITGTGHYKQLTISNASSQYGESLITIGLCDTGLQSDNAPELSYTAASNTLTVSWTAATNKLSSYLYSVNRSNKSITNGYYNFKRVGYTSNTSFIDTNVVAGNKYYYFITWVASTTPSNVLCTNYSFTWKVAPEIPLVFVGNGVGFQAKSGKQYNVMTKSGNMTNQVSWQTLSSVSVASDRFVMLQGDSFYNKPIYVREIQ